jgi:hypothetical protein
MANGKKVTMRYREENKMRCPHLIKWITFLCKAKDEVYFPSSFQLDEYCKKKEHSKCPFFARNSFSNINAGCYAAFH